MGVVLAENELESLFAKLIDDLEGAMPTFKIHGHRIVAAYRRPAATAERVLRELRRSIKMDGLDPLRREVVMRSPWDMEVKEVELWPHPEYNGATHIDFVGRASGSTESMGFIILPPDRPGADGLTVLALRAFNMVYVPGSETVEKYVKLYKRVATFICNVKNCLVKALDGAGRKYAELHYRFCDALKDGNQLGTA